MDNNTSKQFFNAPDRRGQIELASKKIEQAKNTIKSAVIIHLLFTAILAFLLAKSYSDNRENIIRLAEGSSCLKMIIPVFIADSALALLWMYRRIFHTLHLVIYILLGGWFYLYYIADCMNLIGSAIFAVFFITPFIWVFGLISFIACGTGRQSLTSAIKEYEFYARSLPTEDRSQS